MSTRTRAWPLPLRWSLPAAFAVLAIAVTGVESAIDASRMRAQTAETQRDQIARDLSLTTESFDYYAPRGEQDRMRQKLAYAALSPAVIGSAVIDASGRVVMATRLETAGSTFDEAFGVLGLAVPPEIRQLLARPPTIDGPTIIQTEGATWGVIAVRLAGESPHAVRAAWLVEVASVEQAYATDRAGDYVSLVWSAILAILFAGLMALAVRRIVGHRVEHLVSVARDVAAGDLGARAELSGADELAELGTAFDVMTAQVAADRERLRDREGRLRQIFDASRDAIVLADADGQILDVNPRACELFGLPRERLLTMPLDELGDPAVEAGRRFPLQPAGGGKTLANVRCRRSEGQLFDVEVDARKLPDGRVLVVIHDVSEQRMLRAQVMMADRLASIGTLAAGVAHEINNPLAYVLGNLQLALERLDRSSGERIDSELRVLLSDVQDGAQRVASVVRDLRSFTRSDEESTTDVDLRRIAETAIKLTSTETRHRATVDVELLDAPLVHANEGRLVQVLVNLVVNASHAFDEASAATNKITITVDTSPTGEARVRIRDNGPGIPAHIQQRMFEPFVTTKPAGIGTGLGLWVCHNIVSALKGRIVVESSAAGTRFDILLPAVERPVTRPSEPVRDIGLAGLEILVIDDEPLVARVIKRALREANVDIVDRGEHGLERLRTRTYDVVLCDLHMPGVDGLEVMETLERERPELAARVLLVSGGAATDRARAAMVRFSDRLIEKPFAAALLRERVGVLAARFGHKG